MQTSLFLAFLTAFMLHVVGLAVMSFGWQAWRESWPRSEPLATPLIAVTPVPEPTPPPPESPPEPVSIPDVDSVPEPVPATPPLSAPMAVPTPMPPPPPKQAEPRPKPVPVAPTQPPKLQPARERAPRPAPVPREAKASPPPGLRNEPLGSAGSGAPGASPTSATPGQETPQPVAPAEGAGVGPLFAHGDMPVAPGSGGSGEGTGGGRARGRYWGGRWRRYRAGKRRRVGPWDRERQWHLSPPHRGLSSQTALSRVGQATGDRGHRASTDADYGARESGRHPGGTLYRIPGAGRVRHGSGAALAL